MKSDHAARGLGYRASRELRRLKDRAKIALTHAQEMRASITKGRSLDVILTDLWPVIEELLEIIILTQSIPIAQTETDDRTRLIAFMQDFRDGEPPDRQAAIDQFLAEFAHTNA